MNQIGDRLLNLESNNTDSDENPQKTGKEKYIPSYVKVKIEKIDQDLSKLLDEIDPESTDLKLKDRFSDKLQERMINSPHSIEYLEKINQLLDKREQIFNKEYDKNIDKKIEIIITSLREVLAKGAGPGLVAACLAGIGTPESMAFREQLLKDGAGMENIALGLSGVGTIESMDLRKRLIKDGVDKDIIAQTLVGVSTPESMVLRKELHKEGVDIDLLAIGLAGVATPESMVLREEIFNKVKDSDNLAKSLIGVDMPGSTELRKKLIEKGSSKDAICGSLIGTHTPESQELLEKLIKDGANQYYKLISIMGDDSPESNALREKMFQEINYDDLCFFIPQLFGLESPESMILREKIMEDVISYGMAENPSLNREGVLEKLIKDETPEISWLAWSLVGTTSKEAMDFRNKYFRTSPILIAKSYSLQEPFAAVYLCKYGFEES